MATEDTREATEEQREAAIGAAAYAYHGGRGAPPSNLTLDAQHLHQTTLAIDAYEHARFVSQVAPDREAEARVENELRTALGPRLDGLTDLVIRNIARQICAALATPSNPSDAARRKLEDLAALKGRTMEQIIDDAWEMERNLAVVVCERCQHAQEQPRAVIPSNPGDPTGFSDETVTEVARAIFRAYEEGSGRELEWDQCNTQDLYRSDARKALTAAKSLQPQPQGETDG